MELEPTKRFSVRVEAYVRYRPDYPHEIVDLLQRECGLTRDSTIADIGSGPGFLSRVFLSFGCEVYGVEPNPEMRAAGARIFTDDPRFHSVDGRAEATTLPDASVDFVTAGQSLHWFEPAPARREFRRILKPGGWLAAVWNQRKVEAAGFSAAYEALLDRYAREYPGHSRMNEGMLDRIFQHHAWKRAQFANQQTLDLESLRGRLESSSYAPLPGTPDYEPMIRDLERLFHDHQQDGRVTVDYETKVYFGHLPE